MPDNAELDRLYAEAKSALKSREYDRAMGLLTQILVIDENYKDVSRLLAQTVKLKRRKWYSHPALWGTLGFLLLVGLGFFIAPKISGLYAAQPAAQVVNTTTESSPIPGATPAATLLPTPTPIPLTWKRISMGLEYPRDLIIALVIDPEDPDMLFVDTQHAGIYKSINGGISWGPVQPNELSNNQSLILEKASNDASQHVSAFYNTAPDGIMRLYQYLGCGYNTISSWSISEDGGATCRGFSEGGTFHEFNPIAFDKLGAVYVFCGRNICKFSPNGKLLNISSEPGIDGQSVIAVSPKDPNTIYAAGNGIVISRDGGSTWARLDNGIGSEALHLEAGTGSPPILYLLLGVCFNTGAKEGVIQPLYLSKDGGVTWEFITQRGCFLIRDADGKTLYRHGVWEDFEPWFNGLMLYKGWMWRSSNSGETWNKIASISSGFHTLIAHPEQSGLLYANDNLAPILYGNNKQAPQTHQFISTNHGTSWENNTSLAVRPCYGATNHLLNDYKPISIDPQNSNHVLFVENNELWESHDGCSTSNFAQIKLGFTAVISSIAIDTRNPNTFYVGTDIGAYISFDSGKTWGQVNDGLLGATVVYSIAVDKDSNVYVATPYGIFKLESK